LEFSDNKFRVYAFYLLYVSYTWNILMRMRIIIIRNTSRGCKNI